MNLRVLHLSSESSWRGGEQQIAYLIDELQSRGVQNHIVCKKNSQFSAYCVRKEWDFMEAGFNGIFDWRTPSLVKQYCIRNSIDIVHLHTSKAHTAGVFSSFLGNKVKMILSRRVIFKIKNNPFTKWKYKHPGINKIICISDRVKKIMETYIQEPNKCVRIYDGIDFEKFERGIQCKVREKYQIDEESILIGNTSALTPEKDYVTFINTGIELVTKYKINAKFLIVGQGKDERALKEYVQSTGYEQRFIFTGFIDDVTDILLQLDYFLFTSRLEGLGTSLLDAMACKIPIVSTNAGAIPEIVIDEATGLTAGLGDYKKLASNLNKLINTPLLRKQVINNAVKRLSMFDKKVMGRSTLDVYTQVMK